MKKLTWALLSLMLFLGLGVAFAQETEGGGETPTITVPAPVLDPGDGSTVTPKKEITPLGEGACMEFATQGKMIGVMYVWDDASVTLEATEDLMQTASGEGEAAYKAAIWFMEWRSLIEAPETAGSHTLKVRLVAIPNPYAGMSAQAKAGDFDDAAYIYGQEITATYTVAGEAVVETLTAPELSPATGAVSYNGRVNVTVDEAYEDNPQYGVFYVKNNPSFDFPSYTSVEDAEAAGAINMMDLFVNKITESQTITVAVFKLNASNGTIAAWSDPVTGTYTVPAAPTFNPDGGTIALDAQIELATTTPDGKIYCTRDAAAATFTNIKTKEALESSTAVMPYFEDDMTSLAEFGADAGETLNVVAATALINEDGSVAWSDVISKSFTAEEGETPGDEVAQPTIKPNDAFVKVGDQVTIECTTSGATIYYTTDGTAPSAASTEYTAAFAITVAMVPDDGELKIRAIAIKDGQSASARTTLMVRPDAPTFDPEAGEVAFGTLVELDCNLPKAKIYFTTDGTEPTEESEEYSYLSEIIITEPMTVKAIAVLGQNESDMAEASYTVAPVSATLSISSTMLDNMVGKNVNVGFSISDPENPESQGWMYANPAVMYYTVDGETEPSKDAYEAQADKENGAVKKVATVEDEEYGGNVADAYGNILWLTFDKNTHLKAIGYLTMGGVEIVTPVFDEEIKVKSLENPTFDPVSGTMMTVGDKLVIKNPAPAPAEDEEVTAAPEGTLYFSFDGTKPTSTGYLAQEADWDLDKPYSTYKIFKAEGVDVEITFGQDEEGYYAYVPVITDVFNMPGYDKIRLGADGHFKVEVFAEAAEAIKDPMAWFPKMFPYGSDFVSAEYTVAKLELPETVTKPTFVPAPAAGALAQGDAVKFEMDASYEKYSRQGGEVAVAYVINGTADALNIDGQKLGELMEDYATGYSAGAHEDGKVYLYKEEKDAFLINADINVKARQIVAIAVEGEEEDEYDVQFKLSEIVEANYTVDASKLAKPSFKTPKAGSTVEPNSPITFEMPSRYDWDAYGNIAFILYVENNATAKLEGTAEDIMTANADVPSTDAKAGLAYKVVNCAKDGDDLNWTKALIETESGALTIRARLAGINLDDEVFYSDEITVSCTVAKGEGPGDDPVNPSLPATVKAPVFVPAAGEVEKGTAITWTWDEAYNEETYPMVMVAYVVNGEDAALDITIENFGELWNASQEEDETTVREEGVTYLYRTDADAYPYHIEKASTVKARLIIGVLDETGESAIALSEIVTAEYTVKGETPVVETVAKPTFNPAAGEVEKGTKVEIACTTEGAVIYYTVDGSEPTDKSTKYGAAIEINADMTVKAIAVKGDAKSEVATAAYTVKVANEGLELSGVSVYPNPSNGMFNLELPCAATVEVFASNGMLMQRFNAAEGNATLNIERSGIYFLRITGEGRTTVKRLIVR